MEQVSIIITTIGRSEQQLVLVQKFLLLPMLVLLTIMLVQEMQFVLPIMERPL